ncbi:hypothetical protein [Mucilaginibacter phyllosphaerae]
MTTKKISLPAKQVESRYSAVKINLSGSCAAAANTTSLGDPTNFCTTLFTTTHFV